MTGIGIGLPISGLIAKQSNKKNEDAKEGKIARHRARSERTLDAFFSRDWNIYSPLSSELDLSGPKRTS